MALRTRLFSWGYDGWGNATREARRAFDADEAERGFAPPIFVDVRISRAVRAKGFVGSTFATTVGASRYRWFKSLGNRRIETRTGAMIQIDDPSSAADLLQLALVASEEDRRVVFFCSCPWPKCDSRVRCHRHTVGTLLLWEARRHAASVEVVEWPGGAPRRVEVEVDDGTFAAVVRGRLSIPLPGRVDLAAFAGLPWGSVVTVRGASDHVHRLTGPAKLWRVEPARAVVVLRIDRDIGFVPEEGSHAATHDGTRTALTRRVRS